MSKRIENILMQRDGIDRAEAASIIRECTEELHEALDSGCGVCGAEDIVQDWLGLEPDYLMDLI